MQNIKSAA